MRYIGYYADTGEVVGIYSTDGEDAPIVETGVSLIPIEDSIVLPELFYLDEHMQVIEIPESPDPFYIFCPYSKKWVNDPTVEVRIKNYKELRQEEYPPIGDQLDAIYKLTEALQETLNLPPEVQSWISELDAVKAKFPKDSD